ncbi:MAG TPA: DUF4266 domain-containing protein [Fibrobacteria bacterium]|nr:DUF4266 domain-containing protein [Fibrobacteria bacterium]
MNNMGVTANENQAMVAGLPLCKRGWLASNGARALLLAALAAAFLAIASLAGCAAVPQAEREFLSDRIMQRQEDGLESGLEGHDFPRREGSVGGSSGSGGGCGC